MTVTNPIQPTFQALSKPDPRSIDVSLSEEIRKQINCARPGVIQSFDASNQTVTVQIAQQQVTSVQPDGTRTTATYSPLVNVPVFYPCGGGYTLTFPIKTGDECIVIFNDRELDNFMLSGGTLSVPSTPRLHDWSDAYALVGIRSYPRSLSGVSTSTAQLRSDDGATFVEIDGTGQIVTITAPTQINLNSPLVTVQGVINVINENSASVPFTVNGAIHTTGDVVAGSISLQTHVHGGVQTGGGDTGSPI